MINAAARSTCGDFLPVTAFHQSGHAVAAYAFGGPVKAPIGPGA
jgi:hypothetical protein